MRVCPFDNCGKPIPPDKFACYPHWRQLSPGHQARVHAMYADYLGDRIDVERLRELQQAVLDEHHGRRVETARCRSCDAEILWCKTPAGKVMPVDVKLSEKGNMVIRTTEDGTRIAEVVERGLFGVNTPLHISHFATCPTAQMHRKPK